jgi:GH24 family phage-related lysozyme (muramidase)
MRSEGYLTIGYGHLIKKGEYFPNQITREQADSLLIIDFNKRIESVKRCTDLEGSQLIAIAHFVYAKGIGRFKRSALFKLIQNKEPIDQEIVKWCYYRNVRGENMRSEGMYNNRLIELEMFKNGMR